MWNTDITTCQNETQTAEAIKEAEAKCAAMIREAEAQCATQAYTLENLMRKVCLNWSVKH